MHCFCLGLRGELCVVYCGGGGVRVKGGKSGAGFSVEASRARIEES
jgi:hypothetical protein